MEQLQFVCLRKLHVMLHELELELELGLEFGTRSGTSVSRGSDLFGRIEKRCKRNTIFSKHYTVIMDSTMDSKRYAQENEPELSPLEQEVLDEYAKLVGNLDNVHCFFLFTNLSTDHTDTSL
jgi:hypothetical protein